MGQHSLGVGNGDQDEIDLRWEQVLDELDNESVSRPSINSVGDLRNKIRAESFQKTPISRRLKDKKYLQATDFALNTQSLSQLQDILGDQIIFDDKDDDKLEDASKLLDEDDSVFLDAETYLHYSTMDSGMELRNEYDGYNTRVPPTISEQQLMEFAMPPSAPYYDDVVGGKEPTFDDILNLHRNMKERKPPSPEEEKEIFDQVFSDERAYLEQTSEMFREGLTNKTAAQEATYQRRSRQYRKNLLKELSKLEIQIQEFEALLEQEDRNICNQISTGDSDASEEISSSQGRVVGPYVDQSTRQKDVAADLETPLQNTGDEWVLVDDPSTGEMFYWNSRTGEMKLDLSSEEMENDL